MMNSPYVISGIVLVVAAAWPLARRQRRRAHQSVLDAGVLTPLAEQLESWRPRIWGREPVAEIVGSKEGATVWSRKLSPDPSNQPLWRDARGHYPELFTEYEAIRAVLTTASDEVAEWVNGMARELAAAGPLPPAATQYAVPFMDPLKLAVYLYARLAGLPLASLEAAQLTIAEQDGGVFMLRAGSESFAAAQDPASVEAVRSKAEAMIRSQVAEMMRLRERFTKLQVAHDRLLYHLAALRRQPLPGKCGR
ncbi:MAG: hypothetical protein ACYC6M_14905 [Terriglobales bacterium]